MFQAQECLCPLNNLRLLPSSDGQWKQCPRNQLATPDLCRKCLRDNERFSGGLHRSERALCGVGSTKYDEHLRRSLAGAEAVMVMNPIIETMIAPYANHVVVVPAAIDGRRFPWPSSRRQLESSPSDRQVIFSPEWSTNRSKGFRCSMRPAKCSGNIARTLFSVDWESRSAGGSLYQLYRMEVTRGVSNILGRRGHMRCSFYCSRVLWTGCRRGHGSR